MVSFPVTAAIPLHLDGHGVLRVGGTRVTLDIVVESFGEGATPEEIVLQYPTLKLADVYHVIGYLDHYTEVTSYLQQRELAALSVRGLNESKFAPDGIRDRLLARRTS